MNRRVVLLVAVLAVAVGVFVFGTANVLRSGIQEVIITVSATPLPMDTDAPTRTATTRPTETYTPTSTATASITPSLTPTLSTLVVQVSAINSDVTLASVSTAQPARSATPLPTLLVPSPGLTLVYLPTSSTVQSVGWFRYGVDHSDLKRIGQWPGARLTLHFLGAAARVRYARLSSYGVFEVRIDGRTVTTVDAYIPKSATNGDFATTEVFGLVHGWHTLDILRLK